MLTFVFRYIQIVRVIKGRGDVFDTSGRIASIKGAALNVAAPGKSEGTVNLSQENEDLKVDQKFILVLQQILEQVSKASIHKIRAYVTSLGHNFRVAK